MLFDALELKALQSQLLQKHSEPEYVAKAVKSIADMVQTGPDVWKRFGPYWPQVQALIMRYQPELTQRVQQWGEPPDFLSKYSYGDDMLNAIAALQYLNREGDYLSPVGHPHSIEMPDGSNALYSPGVGIIES
jgi:hypothetical protein